MYQVLISEYKKLIGEVVVLYHANCVDGFYAHILLRKFFNDTSTDDMEHVKDYKLVPYQSSKGNWYVPVAYEETKQLPPELQDLVRGKHVIVADFSFEIPALRLLSELAKSVLVIDHHKTLHERVSEHNRDANNDPIKMRYLAELKNASNIRYLMPPPDYKHLGVPDEEQDMFSPFKNTLVVYDPVYCGAMLVGILFGLVDLSNEISSILEYIQDYDLYNIELTKTRQIQAALHHSMYTRALSFWDILDSYGEIRYEHEMHMLVSTGWILIEAAEKQLQAYISTANEGLFAGQKFIFVNAPSDFANSIGEKLSNETGLPVAIWITRKDYTKVSLRSSKAKGNFDVSAIASHYGGGGHHNAASFSFPIGDDLGRLFL